MSVKVVKSQVIKRILEIFYGQSKSTIHSKITQVKADHSHDTQKSTHKRPKIHFIPLKQEDYGWFESWGIYLGWLDKQESSRELTNINNNIYTSRRHANPVQLNAIIAQMINYRDTHQCSWHDDRISDGTQLISNLINHWLEEYNATGDLGYIYGLKDFLDQIRAEASALKLSELGDSKVEKSSFVSLIDNIREHINLLANEKINAQKENQLQEARDVFSPEVLFNQTNDFLLNVLIELDIPRDFVGELSRSDTFHYLMNASYQQFRQEKTVQDVEGNLFNCPVLDRQHYKVIENPRRYELVKTLVGAQQRIKTTIRQYVNAFDDESTNATASLRKILQAKQAVQSIIVPQATDEFDEINTKSRVILSEFIHAQLNLLIYIELFNSFAEIGQNKLFLIKLMFQGKLELFNISYLNVLQDYKDKLQVLEKKIAQMKRDRFKLETGYTLKHHSTMSLETLTELAMQQHVKYEQALRAIPEDRDKFRKQQQKLARASRLMMTLNQKETKEFLSSVPNTPGPSRASSSMRKPQPLFAQRSPTMPRKNPRITPEQKKKLEHYETLSKELQSKKELSPVLQKYIPKITQKSVVQPSSVAQLLIFTEQARTSAKTHNDVLWLQSNLSAVSKLCTRYERLLNRLEFYKDEYVKNVRSIKANGPWWLRWKHNNNGIRNAENHFKSWKQKHRAELLAQFNQRLITFLQNSKVQHFDETKLAQDVFCASVQELVDITKESVLQWKKGNLNPHSYKTHMLAYLNELQTIANIKTQDEVKLSEKQQKKLPGQYKTNARHRNLVHRDARLKSEYNEIFFNQHYKERYLENNTSWRSDRQMAKVIWKEYQALVQVNPVSVQSHK